MVDLDLQVDADRDGVSDAGWTVVIYNQCWSISAARVVVVVVGGGTNEVELVATSHLFMSV